MQSDFSDITVVTPTLNEAATVGLLIDKLSDYYPGIHLIVVDDASTDGTQEVVSSTEKKFAGRDFSLFLLERSAEAEAGLTASVIDGIEQVKTAYTVVIDADLQHPPEILRQMYAEVKDGTDIVIGARRPYSERQGFHRTLITWLATKAAFFHLRLKGFIVADPMSGLFMVRTDLFQEVLEKHRDRFEMSGYKVLFDFLKSAPETLRVKNHYYDFGVRSGGDSKLRPAHAFYFLRSLFK